MKRAVTVLARLLLAGLLAVGLNAADKKPSQTQAADTNYFAQGGREIGSNYAQGGQELGQGAAGFGKNIAQGEPGKAGRALGQGAAGFGKDIGNGTGRGFKNVGLGFREVGKKISGFFTQ